ncbi:MAG: aromatic amino acid lyase, partial [Balneolaceae bacterium]
HVSMGSIGALHLKRVYENVEHVLAIELFTAAQALDFRKPLRPGRGVEAAHEEIRRRIPHAFSDSLFKEDIAKARHMLEDRSFVELIRAELRGDD